MTEPHRDRHLAIIAELQRRSPCQKDHRLDILQEHTFRCYPDELVKAVVAEWSANGHAK